MGLTRKVAFTAAAGYGAGQLMDRVTTAYLERQSEESKRREREVQPQQSVVVMVKKFAEATNRQIDEEQAQKLGQLAHKLFGISGGFTAATLLARGWPALPAGIATGFMLWLLFDEGVNPALGWSAPATEFPRETHFRALAGHVAYGVALGTLLGIARRLWRDEPHD